MLPKVKREPKAKTAEQALAALMRMAARAERSSGDALRLMQRWGVPAAERPKVLKKLTEAKFIDDSRYASAFVRDKLRFSGWGVYKIKAALRAKGIAAETIDEALAAETDSSQMNERLAAMLGRKARSVKYTTTYELKNKLLRYGTSLGYDFGTVADAVAQLLKNQNEECDDFL